MTTPFDKLIERLELEQAEALKMKKQAHDTPHEADMLQGEYDGYTVALFLANLAKDDWKKEEEERELDNWASWNILDVQDTGKDRLTLITKEFARGVISYMRYEHDWGIGVSWDTVQYFFERLQEEEPDWWMEVPEEEFPQDDGGDYENIWLEDYREQQSRTFRRLIRTNNEDKKGYQKDEA